MTINATHGLPLFLGICCGEPWRGPSATESPVESFSVLSAMATTQPKPMPVANKPKIPLRDQPELPSLFPLGPGLHLARGSLLRSQLFCSFCGPGLISGLGSP